LLRSVTGQFADSPQYVVQDEPAPNALQHPTSLNSLRSHSTDAFVYMRFFAETRRPQNIP